MKVAFYTLGCKTNQFETQGLQRIFVKKGHEIVDFSEKADVYIVNSCTVTALADKKSRNAARRAKALNPEGILVVCGCHSQMDPEKVRESCGADIVLGTQMKSRIPELCEAMFAGMPEPCFQKSEGFDILPPGGLSDRTRALLKIQDGCRNFCTYCRIPYARGEYRSLKLSEIKKQCLELKAMDYREIVVTGIEISSYGIDLKDVSLKDALAVILENSPGIRIRLGSLEPRTVSREFLKALEPFRNLCPHFHLSLQSGCDKTLKAMNRKYVAERFYESCRLLREQYPGCAITTDLIVGFPGETERNFEESMTFIEKCAFAQVHVFPFSRRAGTAAFNMPGQLTNAEKSRRAAIAQEISDRMTAEYLSSKIGTCAEVLFETAEKGFNFGHSPDYCRVMTKDSVDKNDIVKIKIESSDGKNLYGSRV